MLIIAINFKWKEYPNSPRATKYSKILGILLSSAMTFVYSFLFIGILGFILAECGADEETAYGISFFALIPLLVLRFFFKKKMEAKIEAIARADAQRAFFNSFNNFNPDQF